MASKQKAASLARWFVLGRHRHHPLVNVIKLNGVISAPSGSRSPQSRRTLNLERVEKWLKRSTQLSPDYIAVIVNSPGGSPAQSELIYEAIRQMSRETKIPVYTFAEDVAASGGYWLLCSGTRAYACKSSIIGSIGVISANFGLVTLAERYGIERRIWTAGKAKVPIDPFSPVSEAQEQRLTDILQDLHCSFKEAVKEARGDQLLIKTKEDEEEIFSGRIWTGKQAVEAGLIDGVGTMEATMKDVLGAEKVNFRLCSDPPQPGLRDILGVQSSLLSRFGTHSWDDAAYSAARAAVLGAQDGLEEEMLQTTVAGRIK